MIKIRCPWNFEIQTCEQCCHAMKAFHSPTHMKATSFQHNSDTVSSAFIQSFSVRSKQEERRLCVFRILHSDKAQTARVKMI